MEKAHCQRCDSVLPPYHVGRLCPACQLEMLESGGKAPQLHYTLRDMMELLGLVSEEQVRRLSRAGKIAGRVPLVKEHIFFKEIVDAWIRQAGRIAREPASPLQEEARRMCLADDHGWLSDPRFDGEAYLSRERSIEHSDYTLGAGFDRECYFCGHTEFVPIG